MKRKKPDIYKFGLILLLITLILTVFRLVLKEQKLEKEVKEATTTPVVNEAASTSGILNWETYTNDKYKFEFKYPRLLYKREYVDQGGYVLFIRFEETEYDKSKGLAVGVSKDNLDTEVARTKKMFEEEGAVLTAESNFNINSNAAKKMEFIPKEGESGELRTVVIVNNGNYSYSFSSVPEQLDQVIKTIVFTEQPTINAKESGQNSFCGGLGGLPCPAGFTCKLEGDYPDAGGECVKN